MNRRSRRHLTAVEVVAATVVVILDVLLPSLVIVALATVSLAVRRESPRSLGLVRPARAWRLCGMMFGFAVLWTFLSLALFIPAANHLFGQQQNTSDFADLQGNLGMLAFLLVASWTLAAFVEEFAFRGYLLARLTEVLGGSSGATALGVLVSSALFGLIHTEQGPVGVALATIDGIAYAFLRFRFGTLWAPVLAHGFINTIGFVAFFFVGPVSGFW